MTVRARPKSGPFRRRGPTRHHRGGGRSAVRRGTANARTAPGRHCAAQWLAGRITHAVLMGALVQLVFQVVIEREFGGGQAGVELLGAACPDDGRRDGLIRQYPGDREGHEAHPSFLRQLAQHFDGVELAIVPVAVLVGLRGAAEGEASTFWRRRSPGVLARQQPAGDGVVGNDADTFLAAEREHLPLDLAEEQVIAGLDGVEAGQVERLASADGSYQLIGQEVRAADVADLSLMDKVVEGAQRLVDRCFRVIPVKLVKVDVVGLQTSQGGIDSGQDVLARVAGVEGRRPRRGEALGGNDETVPLPPEPAAEDLLGNPAGGEIPAQRVGVGGVEEVNTALGRPVENGDSGGLIALQPEGHRPEAQPRNLEAGPAESGVFHGRTLPGSCASWAGRPARSRSSGGRGHRQTLQGRGAVCSTDECALNAASEADRRYIRGGSVTAGEAAVALLDTQLAVWIVGGLLVAGGVERGGFGWAEMQVSGAKVG